MSENSYRIRTTVGEDSVIKVNISQDIDFFEILSLKLGQEDAYKIHTSNYGVIVGRVLANDAFGIPNAKISVFIPIEDEDKANSEISSLYPYATVRTKNKSGIRYNLLRDENPNICNRIVGTFPNKRLVLDNNTEIEIFDKYWKYTTVTNNAGDYMIFGVPCGDNNVHVDIDLSDCGILSQRPIDFMYKGYDITQFDNARQFKESTNLDNLAQIISQDKSVYVYPFWGDKNAEEIAISRCDVQIQYKFEPTCVFMGSIVTDNYTNNINHKCTASKYAGYNRNLVSPEGTIEMIRKTTDGLVEEYQIQGNRLIDSDGVFCYQIPMNLDYIGTDEYGNIVPTDNPNKGVATKTTVRFRFSIQETGNEGVSRHRAKYLVPNNPLLYDGDDYVGENTDSNVRIPSGKQFARCFEFGSATQDSDFRDLYWNKVYSIKNYIPRIQTSSSKGNRNYSCLRSTNFNDAANPIPFNNIRIRLSFMYKLICLITSIIAKIIEMINELIIGTLDQMLCPLKVGFIRVRLFCVKCINFNMVEDEDGTNEVQYYPGCRNDKAKTYTQKEDHIEVNSSYNELMDKVQQNLALEYEVANLDFYNDWLNGCLYFPLWFWKKTKKKKFLFGLFSKKAVNQFCNCDKSFGKLRVTQGCAFKYDRNTFDIKNGDNKIGKYHFERDFSRKSTIYGVIKEVQNKAGLNIYYYAPGNPTEANYTNKDVPVDYVRLYSTDIILLGTLNDCDLDNLPQFFKQLPSTTSNAPFISTVIETIEEDDEQEVNSGKYEDDDPKKTDENTVEVSGMDWLHWGDSDKPIYKKGLFFNLACLYADTGLKTCVNTDRLCELGVTLDGHVEDTISKNGTLARNIIYADGMINRYELMDNESRAMFASMNHNGLTHKVHNANTNYDTYKLDYIYPVDFDGHLGAANVSESYTKAMEIKTYDYKDNGYVNFRLGKNDNYKKFHFYNDNFPLFNNSFYFYFGLNEGNTAIDKFNKNYYADCFRNEKFPFTMIIDSEAAAWTPCADCQYGAIEVELPDIRAPYSYSLSDEFDNELISENGMTVKKMKLGYKVTESGYSETEKGKLQYYLPKIEEHKDEFPKNNNEDIFLTNGNYKLTISDAYNKSVTQMITLTQSQIGLNYETVELGTKYYEGKTTAKDICPDYFGEIRIKNIIIDGELYKINSIVETKGVDSFKLEVENISGSTCTQGKRYYVLLDIEPQIDKFNTENAVYYLDECECTAARGHAADDCGGLGHDIKNNQFVVHVWLPGKYKLTVTQYDCEGELLTDNTSTETATVKNGEPFNAYIDEVPMKFLIGDTSKPPVNGNFYNKNNSATNPQDSSMIGWFNLLDESKYYFSATTREYLDIWSDFTTVTTASTSYLENGVCKPTSGVVNDEYVDEGGLINIVDYKLKSLFSIAKKTWISDDSVTKLLSISHTGGQSPTVYRGSYPKYDEFEETQADVTNEDADKFAEWITNNSGYAATDLMSANIVSPTYTRKIANNFGIPAAYKETIGWEMPTVFNPIFQLQSKLGNYFAAFTKNASWTDGCAEANIRYQKIPYESNRLDDDYCSVGEQDVFDSGVEGDTTHNAYFRGEFIDRRLDYSMFIMTPYCGEEVIHITSDTETWQYGRIYGTFFNGIDMAYDQKTYEIINPTLNDKDNNHYEINVELDECNQIARTWYNQNNDANQRYYDAILKVGSTKVNIKNAMNSTHHDAEALNGSGTIQIVNNTDASENELKRNGAFGINNYPTKRFINISGLTPSNKLEFAVTSCTLNCEYRYDGDIGAFTGTTEGGEEVSFAMSCKNMIKNLLPNLEDCAQTQAYNIEYDYEGGILKPKNLKVEFNLLADTVNDTHNVFTKIPRLINLYKGGTNPYEEALQAQSLNGIMTPLRENSTAITYDNKSLNGIQETGADVDTGILKDYGKLESKFFTIGNDSDATIAYDSYNDVGKVIYQINKSLSKDDRAYGVLLERNYINASNNRLLYEVKAIEMTAVFDVRKIQFTCAESKTITSKTNDTQTETKVTGTVEVPTINVDVSGNPSFSSDNEEINADASSSSETKSYIQYTSFKITTTPSALTYNQQFTDETKMKAVLRVGDSVTSDVTISKDGNDIFINVNWTGALSDKYVNKTPFKDASTISCELYVSLPNKLIYRFNFRLQGIGETGANVLNP